MARSRGGRATPARSAPPRPVAAPARPSVPAQRPASTAAAQPPARAGQPQQAGQSPGLFGQMASTAAGVAVGSSIGHAIGGFFGGGSSQAAEAQPTDTGLMEQSNANYQSNAFGSCEDSAKAFTKCLDENAGRQYQMNICSYYLDQLKACQAAASKY